MTQLEIVSNRTAEIFNTRLRPARIAVYEDARREGRKPTEEELRELREADAQWMASVKDERELLGM